MSDSSVPAPFHDAEGVAHYRNISVADIRGFRPVHMDVRVPAGEGRRPLIAWIHGGAFWEGSRVGLPSTLDALQPPAFRDRLVARGYAVADLDYRLSGEAKFPAQLDDVQAALAWLHEFSDDLNLDVGRFAVWGESAGATLAALAALDKDFATPVRAAVVWYAPTDFVGGGAGPEVPGDPAYELLDGGAPGLAERALAASPLHRVHADAPPFLIMHGTDDRQVPYVGSERLAEALRAVGVRADLVPIEGATHVFEGIGDISGLIETVLDFLDDVVTQCGS